MTAQEKINQLATAALRSGPPAPVAPKPATYMAPFEKPKTVALAEVPASAAPVASAEPAAPAAPAEPAAVPFKDEADPALRAQIEEREAFLQKRQQRKSLAVTFGLLALFAAGGTWCYTSPKARAEIGALVPALSQSVEDVKMLGSITKKYDEQLEKIAVRGDQIADATRAMGVDPDSVSPGSNAELDAEMAKMMGEDGPTTGQRDKALQDKFGFIGKLAGDKAKPAAAETTAP
jgi:hypothetical protein